MRTPLIYFIQVLAAVVLSFFISCGEPDHSGSEDRESEEMGQIADALCNCMLPITQLNSRIQEAHQTGESDMADSLFRNVNQIMVEATSCIDSVETSYGTLSESEEGKLEVSLMENCPSIAKVLQEAKRFRKEY